MELNGSGKPLNKPGVYKHKETGAIVELETTPGVGSPTIDAFIQAGFVKVDDSELIKPIVVSDEYTEKVNKNGKLMYYKNGKLISKDEYENK